MSRVVLAWLVASSVAAPPTSAGQAPVNRPTSRATRAEINLPPMSWTCPMHPDIVDDKAGNCPVCKMALVAVRLELDWSCPVHTSVIETKAGHCPICRRNLVQITASVSWICAGHPEVTANSPGPCSLDGRPMVVARARRPHGDHNPRHGGIFFMAADNTHHLEGTYPRAGVFRVFLYDEYTRPLALKGVMARAVTKEMVDQSSNVPRDVEAFPLRPSRDGTYLEAQLGPQATGQTPVQVTAKIRFTPDAAEQRFDFSFQTATNEPTPPTQASRVTSPAAPMTSSPATLPVPDAPAASTTTPALLTSLTTAAEQVRTLLEQGAYMDMYFPALAAKEAALALDDRTGELPTDRRGAASDAVKRVVLGAWLIDAYGDIGDKLKLTEAFDAFAGAVSDLKSVYGQQAR